MTRENASAERQAATALLLQAVRGDNMAALATAYAAGGDVNAREEYTLFTPLMLAVQNKNIEMVSWLLQAGANPSLGGNDGGINAYHLAAAASPAMMQLLLKQPHNAAVHDFYKDGTENIGVLHIALKHADHEMIALLLDFGVNINAKNDNGETPLYYLLQHNRPQMENMPFIRLLVQNGADIDKAENYWEETPLLIAARAGNTLAVSFLLAQGANPNHVSYLQETPLLAAVKSYNNKAVKILLDAGADIEAKSRIGSTALHIAASRNRLDIVKTLLERGADPFALNNEGQTPEALCTAHYQDNVRRLILQKQMEIKFSPEKTMPLGKEFNSVYQKSRPKSLLRRPKKYGGKPYGRRF